MLNREENIVLPTANVEEARRSPVLYSLKGALEDLWAVFLASTILFIPLVLTEVDKLLIGWAQAYPQLHLTELFLYAVLLTAGFGVASLRRWMQLTDLVERYEDSQAQLKQKARELERSNEKLERFATIASHDLREPLRTIHSHLSMVERQTDDLDDSAQESLEYAREGAGRMDRMVKSLLTYSRVESEAAATQPTDPNPALLDAIENLDGRLERAGIDVEPAALPQVMADGNELVIVFQNLLENAIRYTPEGGRVTIDGEQQGDSVRLWIEDQGPGIEPNQQERVFELFRGGTDGEEASSGIGLTLCRSIVERHGGQLWADAHGRAIEAPHDYEPITSEADAEGTRGTRFVIELPAAS